MTTALKLGSGYWWVYRQGPDPTDLKLQFLHPRGMWAHTDSSGEVNRWWWQSPVRDAQWDWSFSSKRINLDPRWVLQFSDEPVDGSPYGRSALFQIINRLIGIENMHRVSEVMARNQSHGILDITVDVSKLSKKRPLNPKTQKREKSPRRLKLERVKSAYDQRVKKDQISGRVIIRNQVVHDQTIDAKPLRLRGDFKGIAMIMDHAQDIADRKSGIPPIFLGKPQSGDSRNASLNQLIVTNIKQEQIWMEYLETCERLFPMLGIRNSRLVPVRSVLQQDDITNAEMAETVLKLYAGVLPGGDTPTPLLTLQESRKELERLIKSVQSDKDLDGKPFNTPRNTESEEEDGI